MRPRSDTWQDRLRTAVCARAGAPDGAEMFAAIPDLPDRDDAVFTAFLAYARELDLPLDWIFSDEWERPHGAK